MTMKNNHADHKKFKEFIKLCNEAKEDDIILIADPKALGDNYDEVILNLERVAKCGAKLHIVKK